MDDNSRLHMSPPPLHQGQRVTGRCVCTASRRMRWKGNPLLGVITGPRCHWGTKYRDLVRQVGSWTQGWPPCCVKKLLLRNPKKWKPDAIWQNLLRKAVAPKGVFCRWWWLVTFSSWRLYTPYFLRRWWSLSWPFEAQLFITMFTKATHLVPSRVGWPSHTTLFL
jgi:hypothetical protein